MHTHDMLYTVHVQGQPFPMIKYFLSAQSSCNIVILYRGTIVLYKVHEIITYM